MFFCNDGPAWTKHVAGANLTFVLRTIVHTLCVMRHAHFMCFVPCTVIQVNPAHCTLHEAAS
jgi:hypothetical protein